MRDVRTGEWVQFAHMAGGQEYELENAARWIDPATGQVQVKFVNERQERHRVPVPGLDRGHRQMSGIVTASGLVKRYDRTLAVAGLDLDVDTGRDLRPGGSQTGPARRRRCASWRRCWCPTGGDAEIAGLAARR